MEVSFSRGETLKRDNVRIVKNRLYFIFVSFYYFILFYFLFFLLVLVFSTLSQSQSHDHIPQSSL